MAAALLPALCRRGRAGAAQPQGRGLRPAGANSVARSLGDPGTRIANLVGDGSKPGALYVQMIHWPPHTMVIRTITPTTATSRCCPAPGGRHGPKFDPERTVPMPAGARHPLRPRDSLRRRQGRRGGDRDRRHRPRRADSGGAEVGSRRALAPQRADARSAPSRIDLSLSHTTGATTHSRPVKVPKPQSAPAITRSRSPTAATASSMRRATTSRMLDEIVGQSITPGISAMCAGSLCFFSASYSCWWRGLANSIDSAPALH